MAKINGSVKILDAKLSETFRVKFDYILLECEICGRKWGVNIQEGNELKLENLLCQACAVKKIASEM